MGTYVTRYVHLDSTSAPPLPVDTHWCLQQAMWKVAADIGKREDRLDICVAAAGVWGELDTPSLEYVDANVQHVSLPLLPCARI